MKTGILITARLGSTRLSQKHLIKVEGKELIKHLIDRIAQEFHSEIAANEIGVIIATGDNPVNKKLAAVCPSCSLFYGDEHNIPKRHLQAAEFYRLSNIISIDGDDILCSTNAMRKVKERLEAGSPMVKTVGLPLGLNVMGYKTELLRRSLAARKYDQLETGWGRIFNSNKIDEIEIKSVDDPKLRFTLDYEEDHLFFKEIITIVGDEISTISDMDLINIVIDNEVYKINSSRVEQYWSNFDRLMNQEETNNAE